MKSQIYTKDKLRGANQLYERSPYYTIRNLILPQGLNFKMSDVLLMNLEIRLDLHIASPK